MGKTQEEAKTQDQGEIKVIDPAAKVEVTADGTGDTSKLTQLSDSEAEQAKAEGEPKIDPAQQQISLTPEHVDDIVKKALADQRAEFQSYLASESEKQTLAAATLQANQEKAAEETEQKAVAKKLSPYGNKDKDKEFDFFKLMPHFKNVGFPTDKVTALIPEYNRNGKGEKTTIDLTSSRVQFYSQTEWNNYTATDKSNGSTGFKLIDTYPIELNNPF